MWKLALLSIWIILLEFRSNSKILLDWLWNFQAINLELFRWNCLWKNFYFRCKFKWLQFLRINSKVHWLDFCQDSTPYQVCSYIFQSFFFFNKSKLWKDLKSHFAEKKLTKKMFKIKKIFWKLNTDLWIDFFIYFSP